MNESTPASGSTEIFQAQTAQRLGIVLVAGLALVVIFNALDKPRRTQFERYEEVTAVGDKAWFRLPETAQKPPPAAAKFRGQELFPVSYKTVEIRDTKMLRVGDDDSGLLRIYASREPVPPQEGEVEKKGETFYFLKTGTGEYIKVRGSTPGM